MSKADLKPATKGDMELLRTEVEGVDQRVIGLEQDMAEMKADMAEMKGEMVVMKGSLASVDEKLDKVIDIVAGLPERVEKLERLAGVRH